MHTGNAARGQTLTALAAAFAQAHVRGVDIFTVRDGLVAEKLSYVKG